MKWAALFAVVLLVPLAAAARDHWVGVGPGKFGPNHCDAAYEVEVVRSSDPSRWDVTITVVPKTTFTAVAVILPQFREECVVPRIREFPDSLGSEVGQWRQDTNTACIDRHLSIRAVSNPNAGTSSLDWWYRDRCQHFFEMGSAPILAFATSDPDLSRLGAQG